MLLKLGIVVVLASLVGSALIHGIMLLRVLRSKLPMRIVIGECLAELLMSARAKDYMTLLSEASKRPTMFDQVIYTLDRLIGWCLGAGLVAVALGLILGC
jgi:flagellar motor component MotA